MPGQQKKYFILTDAKRLYAEHNPKIEKIYQENLGWPNNTLLRFKMFVGIEHLLKQCEYLFFFNANIVFTDKITEEILPDDTNEGLLVVKHPGYWDKPIDAFPYDRNANSKAYIPLGQGKHYFMGGFNGGRTDKYLQLVKILNDNIQIDLQNGVIAKWHDESHLNHYFLDRNPRILSPAYGYVEGYNIPFMPKLRILKKEKFGGHDYLRNLSTTKAIKKNEKWLMLSTFLKRSIFKLKSIVKNQ